VRHLIRQGEGPAAAYARIHHEHAARQAAVDRILREAPDSRTVTTATAAGDAWKLRGIPCIARGVTGATTGQHVDDPRSSPLRSRRRPQG
jgi:hypothetical protein